MLNGGVLIRVMLIYIYFSILLKKITEMNTLCSSFFKFPQSCSTERAKKFGTLLLLTV